MRTYGFPLSDGLKCWTTSLQLLRLDLELYTYFIANDFPKIVALAYFSTAVEY